MKGDVLIAHLFGGEAAIIARFGFSRSSDGASAFGADTWVARARDSNGFTSDKQGYPRESVPHQEFNGSGQRRAMARTHPAARTA